MRRFLQLTMVSFGPSSPCAGERAPSHVHGVSSLPCSAPASSPCVQPYRHFANRVHLPWFARLLRARHSVTARRQQWTRFISVTIRAGSCAPDIGGETGHLWACLIEVIWVASTRRYKSLSQRLFLAIWCFWDSFWHYQDPPPSSGIQLWAP